MTVHEVDAEIDHGPIYFVDRWEIAVNATIQSVYERSVDESPRILEKVCVGIAAGGNGAKCFTPSADRLDESNRHTPIQEISGWFARLDPKHPAHGERVFLNHPRAIINPPYFDDL